MPSDGNTSHGPILNYIYLEMEGPIPNLKGILHKDNIIRNKEIKGYNCSKTTTEQGLSPVGY